MKLSDLTGEPPKSGKMKLSQLTQSKPARAATPEPTEAVTGVQDSRFADLVQGLPQDVAQRIISDADNIKGRAAEVRKHAMIDKAAKLARLRQDDPEIAKKVEGMGTLDNLYAGVAEGFGSLGRGVGLLDPKTPEQEKLDNAVRDQSHVASASKFITQAAPFASVGGAIRAIGSGAARLAAGAGLGAAEGNIISRGEGGTGGEIAASTAIGGLLGGAGEAAIPLFNRIGQAIAKKFTSNVDLERVQLNPDGTLTPEYEAVLKDANIDPKQVIDAVRGNSDDAALNAMREQAFKDLDLPFTEAERTRDKSLWVDQQSQVRRSGAVNELVETREAQIDRLTQQNIEATSGQAERANTNVYDSVVGKSDELASEIDELYSVARDTASDQKVIKFNSTIEALRENAPSNEVSGGVVKALRDKMRAMGVMSKDWAPSGRIDIAQAEELRQYANRLSRSANGEGQYVIRQFKQRLDDDVFQSVDSVGQANLNLFQQARKAKAKFEQSLDPDKVNRFDRRKESLVRDILDNKVSQDTLSDTVLKRSSKYRAADLQELKKYLTTGSDEQIARGFQAWDDLRASALTQIKDKAFTGPVTQQGTQSLSANALDTAINKIGDDKIKVLFSPKERDFLKSLQKVATYKTAPTGTYSPSGPAIERLQSVITSRIPIFGPIVEVAVRSVKDQAAERRLMNVTSQAEAIANEVKRTRLVKFRKSTPGVILQSSPVVAIAPLASSEEK